MTMVFIHAGVNEGVMPFVTRNIQQFAHIIIQPLKKLVSTKTADATGI